ncbi:NAD(P)H-quinone oxidoreductase [Herpetosiphon giganteus]|uniref:NAD(P)H-quinone oxidoreductase n=1 Tax=Herpetosiphon giganteus TaxID=2029754 RepID=UPI00195705B9|nr:NAD(P)H-quinone oxidoreductase [Herpetosiphon giganteus]MBM7845996.1 putative PIG3 family NAD(P)H quinone oxidoreductase [Herpetosiphon giganteus]
MQAIVFDQAGDAEVLRLAEVADLQPQAGELLIRVHATAVNRADILQRRGMYPAPAGASEILGLEIAGEVIGHSAGVSAPALGTRICALLPGGGYAQQVVIPAELAMQIPDSLSYEQAAAIPEVWMTAYDNLFNWGRLSAGERLLVHGGSSGIGTAAIQLAGWRGAEVIITAGSAAKIERCRELGALAGINYRTENWPERLQELTDHQGVDVVLDMLGASYFNANLASLRVGGRLVIIATMGGAQTELDLRTLMLKRLTVCGTTLRARPIAAKAALTQQVLQDVLPRFADGTFKPVIEAVFDLAEASAAHRLLESSQHVGKIVLRVK